MKIEPESVPFDSFVALLQRIAAIPRKPTMSSSRSTTTSEIYKIVDKWTKHLRRSYDPLPKGTTLAFFRLFFPEKGHCRRYGIQESKLGKYVVETLGVSTALGGRAASLLDWKDDDVSVCLGTEVKKIMEETSDTVSSDLSLVEVDNLLTELSCSCGFTAHSIRSSVTDPRTRSVVLHELYTKLSPDAAAAVTQIILRDLRPILYPVQEIHYSSALLDYNTKSLTTISLWDFMKYWDPTGRLGKAYRLLGTLESAAESFENPEIKLAPQIGHPIAIPKCLKGQGCVHSLKLLKRSHKVWAETKYDGERAQIHVEIIDETTLDSRITIFSKSKRDSTLDRMGIHSIIRSALGLPERSDASPDLTKPKFKKTIILEAEMVAFSETDDRIDEFWRIRSLVGSTAYGVRHRTLKPQDSQEEIPLSQSSMISDASGDGTRHLALVFFDVLMVDSDSLMQHTYAERREILESIITLEHGYSMLAERWEIPMNNGPCSTSVGTLGDIFSKLIAAPEEGAILKADEGTYRDYDFPWVKLKKDYIPGYGDTMDLALIGASWEKERARELGVPKAVYTTFYLGALQENNDSPIPHFEIFFTCSYLPSRKNLEELNFMIKSSDPVSYRDTGCNKNVGLEYTFNLFDKIPPPQILLPHPLLVEVYGAGFTKAAQSKFYEIRFPRISKVYRISERSALKYGDGITTIQEFQTLARTSVGKDRPGKAEEDFCKETWDKTAVLSPGVRSDVKRKEREDGWFEKLRAVDEPVLGRKVKRPRVTVKPVTGPIASRSEDENENGSPTPSRNLTRPHVAMGLRAMGSMTNLVVKTGSSSPSPSTTPTPRRQLSTPKTSSISKAAPEIVKLNTPLTDRFRTGLLSPANSQSNLRKEPTVIDLTLSDDDGVDLNTNVTETKTQLETPGLSQILSTQDGPPVTKTPLSRFLEDAVVWLARPADSPRPKWRIPSRQVISKGQQVHTLDSLLAACGWNTVGHSGSVCEWASKGVIFVDDQDDGKPWREFPLGTLLERKQALVKTITQDGKKVEDKPVYIFSMNVLGRQFASSDILNIESLALCRLG